MPQDLILFLAANPRNTSRLALDEECAAIERELCMATNRDFEFQSKWAVTVDELMRQLNALQPTVVHFSGHGTGAGGAGGESSAPLRDVDAATDRRCRSGIYLEDGRGGPQFVTADALTKMIKATAASVRLVVLNACYSEAQADAVCSVVDCVVGMDGAIDDAAARAFAVSFYRALGHRRSVSNAVEQAIATLAGAQLVGEHIPRCRTRDGIDAGQIILGQPVMQRLPWAERFAAVIRLSREAQERLESDPLSAATRAQLAILHIVDYLHEREIGPVDPEAALTARFRRVEAKLVIPWMVVNHFSSVMIHANSILHIDGGTTAHPDPSLLRPCLGSLVVVVEWFFRDYLKQPAPALKWSSAERQGSDQLPIPDVTPNNSTIGTLLSTSARFGAGIGDLMPVWRAAPTASTLRIEAVEGDERKFRIEDPDKTYYFGRTEQRSDGRRNDFALPNTWNSISRDQGTLALRDGGVLLVNTSSKSNVFVRGEVVASRGGRLLRHGDTVQIGHCLGTFVDGRYYPATSATAIDRRTGLLSRLGLVAEIGNILAAGVHRVLLVLRCPEDVMIATSGAGPADPESRAVKIAAALHRYDSSSPVARMGLDVAMLLTSDDSVQVIAVIANRIGWARCVSGFMTLTGTADQALPRLEACLGALSRIAIAGRESISPEDLTRYALVPTPLDAFAMHARPLFELGGGAVLFVLSDLERLERMAPRAVPILELELLEMLGARMGPRDLVSFAGPGSLLFGTSGDVDRLAQEVAVAWHARTPVTVNAFEIDRCLSAHLLAISDLDGLIERTAALARGELSALGASCLPAPLALGAIAIDETRDPIERARALIRLAELGWKLLAFILVASARGLRVREVGDESSASGSWPTPWRSLARAAAHRLTGQPMRVMELASAAVSSDIDGPFLATMTVIAEVAQLVAISTPDPVAVGQSLPRLEKAVREMFAALPLRGWTLVGIVSSEVIDVEGMTQCVEYVDYTGPNARGSHQRVTVTGYRGLGRFAYLVRWDEGLAIALEPFARRTRNEASGDNELFLAISPVLESGVHRYRSVAGTYEIDQQVTTKQLGMSAGRRRDTDDAPER